MQDMMPISFTGREKLFEDLEKLEKDAVETRQRVAEAREEGDLKENGAYIYGRQNLGFIEGRMGEIRAKINHSQPRDCTEVSCEKAGFGTVVTVRNLDTDQKIIWQLLGPYDADLTEDSISILSPVGEALVGLKVGDKVSVEVPRGELQFEMLDIGKSEFK
ncbi:Transcript cleavage factor GreA [Anaerohalosphaera lusitana]|uniref:Transcription elongation factor GreA n=1 Tax=Anaerohalosphaera lusitana TaxID=1936003 RepID=A0A1U9NQC8_9BACT|nr:GreA/GreB family elongation factor [Anaerohalosphaera lusitana]AQT69820.1 Transcript cleavage factor GreA [Anaerohalosphaera lusitana]